MTHDNGAYDKPRRVVYLAQQDMFVRLRDGEARCAASGKRLGRLKTPTLEWIKRRYER